MPSTLPGVADCCDSPCAIPAVVNVPGSQGAAGAAGANGVNGQNSYTLLTSSFVQPAELANVTVAVVSSAWAVPGQGVALPTGGTYQVVSVPDGTHIILKNLADTPNLKYPGNAAPGIVISNGSLIGPAGFQGAAGTAAAAGASKNDSFVTRLADADLTNNTVLALLATGLLKVTTATGALSVAVDGVDYLSELTGLEPDDIGVTVQAFNAQLAAFAALVGAANQFPFFTGPGAFSLTTISAFWQSILSTTNAGAASKLLGLRYGLLGKSLGITLQVQGDKTPVAINSTSYVVKEVILANASAPPGSATIALNGAGGGGAPIICANQAIGTGGILASSNLFFDLLVNGADNNQVLTLATLIPRVGGGLVAATTCDMYILGVDLS